MTSINYQGIQQEIHDNYLDLKSGIIDVYDFVSDISEKYFSLIDPEYGNRVDDDPYTDLLFAMLEINGIELY
jgi:hypothetical protein